jgi:membrane protein
MKKNRHDVDSPVEIRLRDWRSIVIRAGGRAMADHIGLVAAGIAFYAFLSVFPAMAALLMLWGLFNDMASLGPQLQAVREVAPDAFDLVADQMVAIASQPKQDLTIGAIITVLLVIWSASGAVSALMNAMNMAYHEKEKRNFVRLTLISLGFTLAGIVFVGISMAAIAAVPPIVEALYLGAFLEAAIRAVRWLLMIALFLVATAMIYRIAPSRTQARWSWIVPGAFAASIVWLIASIVFSIFLDNFAAYNATFGSLAAVAILLMWFWLSAYAICMGAELNSQLELFTTRDTTIDKPARAGRRGAYVADHIEEPEVAQGPTPQVEDVTLPQELEHKPGSRLSSSQFDNRKAPP